MKIARELERRLERLVDGLSAAVFRGKMHPVDLANRLLRAVDLGYTEGPLGPEVANHLEVRVNPGELDEHMDVAALQAELAAAVSQLAADRGWHIGGPITVHLAADHDVRIGSITLQGRTVPGPIPPWAQLIDAAGGRILAVGDNRAVVGRAQDTDITLSEPEVSRHHALLVRAGGTVWIHDLGSANGTAVNGVRAGAEPVQIRPGDSITIGPATFTFRLV
jgi:hypothetical protein